MRRVEVSVVSIALCLLGLFALPSVGVARTAYFTASEEGGGYAAPIDLNSGAIGTSTPIVTEGAPSDVAIAPDGSTAYVTGFEELVRIDVATNTEEPPIPMSVFEPRAIAIAPDGKHAYTANGFEENVSVIDLSSGVEVGSPIAVGGAAEGIAVTPDGSRAYVSIYNSGEVKVIDLASGTVVGSVPVGANPLGTAVTPDGSRVIVANRGDETVSEIATATNTVIDTISTGTVAERVTVSPDGSHAYVLSLTEGVTPIDLGTGTAASTAPLAGYASDIGILPDGSRAYITHEEAQSPTGDLPSFDLATNMFSAGFELGEAPRALAIVPNQPPHASFTATPQSAEPGQAVAFDGRGSTDSDGTVTRYDWSFGDGSTAPNGGPTPTHSYAAPGTYVVTLTTTDNEGCSTQIVFPGQTAYCNGSSVATTTRTVTIAAAPAPVPAKPVVRCPKGHAAATTFVPKIRPGHVIPGVRVRISTSEPARVKLIAKLHWSKHGLKHKTSLGARKAKIRRWRRIRLALPQSIRHALPYGRRVRLHLRLFAWPLRHSATCKKGSVTHKTLRLRIVKVFPHAVQHDRARKKRRR